MWKSFKSLLKNVQKYAKNCSSYKTELKDNHIMRVLNVAEKNDAAKNIANLLGRGNCNRREGFSVYNKIYEFNCTVWNQNCQMVMTSLSGHLLNYEFGQSFREWNKCHPSTLFDAPVFKICNKDMVNIKKTLEREVRTCDALIIWTDCDREGENIGFEIINVCQAIKPNIPVYRAVFSEITATSVNRALHNLVQPNKLVSDAVDVRSELDLRIGAAFTRFQTLRLQKVFPQTLASMLISYGSCQFPTLGFVVERYLAIENFVSEPYWKIKVTDVRDDLAVEFRWARNRLFEKLPCEIYLDMCLENPEATVESISSKPKSKWRPLPLDTVELEKQGSRKLKMNAKETMKIAEKLYSQGYISYPRTETNIFPKELNLVPLVTEQTQHPSWGNFATRVLNDGITPRQGKKSDQAHPPIHPIKFTNSLQGNEAKVYEFVVRHFLACVSKNAEGHETIVDIDIAGEKFTATGLQILAKNYLDVYIYETWNTKEIHLYQLRQKFMPTEIVMVEEKTSPPNLLTEADLIALMDKHGIGTDATHAEHIDTIKQRHYIGLQGEKYLIPGNLGIGLVMGYDKMGFSMSKPTLRAELERDLKLICEGQKNPHDVLRDQIAKYRQVFLVATEKANLIDTALAGYLTEAPTANVQNNFDIQSPNSVVMKCSKCGSDMHIRNKRQGPGKFIGCSSFPGCKKAIWFPESVEDVQVSEESCQYCPNSTKKIKVKFIRNVNPQFGINYETCIGCDVLLKQYLGIHDENTIRSNQTNNPIVTSVSQSSQNLRVRGNQPAQSVSLNSNFHNNSSQMRNNSIGNISGTTILCYCHQEAVERIVQKEGPNKGRRFFACAKFQSDKCSFFLWKNEHDSNTSSNNTPFNPPPPHPPSLLNNTMRSVPRGNATRGTSRGNGNQCSQTTSNNTSWLDNTVTENIICNCGLPAKRLTVQKDNENKGRLFYVCCNQPPQKCNFFKWADESQLPSTSRGEGSRRGNTQRRPTAAGGRRKCGICGIEGHNRKSCPQNSMD